MTELWYYKQYNKLINKAIKRNPSEIENLPTEKHHILPKCMGGKDEENNLVKLTIKEHIFAHLFLMRAYPNNSKLIYAANRMLSTNKDGIRYPIISSLSIRTISLIRENLSKVRSERMKGENHPRYGKKLSNETKDKIRKARLGTKMPPASEELRRKRSENAKGEKNGMYGKHLSEDTKRKILELRKIGKAGHFSKVQSPDGTIYNSVKSAAEALKVDRHKITDWAKRHPESGWKYVK